jgi:hypothetical protein
MESISENREKPEGYIVWIVHLGGRCILYDACLRMGMMNGNH